MPAGDWAPPPRVTHATRHGRPVSRPHERDLQAQGFADLEQQVGAQKGPTLGQIGRVQPDPSLDLVAGSAYDHGQERIPA